jgi:hypothetical protein
MKPGVILQNCASYEVRTVRVACLLMDGIDIVSSGIEGLPRYARGVASGKLMPVGSVEFVREAMRLAGIAEPASPGFPDSLRPWFFRRIRRVRAGDVLGTVFVKPVALKAFNGFVFDTMRDPSDYDKHDQEQLQAFMAMDSDSEVWVSDVVQFQCEHRYYVVNGKVIGSGRYDPDGLESAPAPDPAQVDAAIQALSWPTPYALDMGVLADGETALVEFDAGWATGLYGSALAPRDYYRFLRTYWDGLCARPATADATSPKEASQP